MIVNRTFDDIMDKSKASRTKQRLGASTSEEERLALRDYAVFYHKDIVNILDEIKRELLLILKTNNYLRAIDRRIGNPTNTFNVINDISYRVYVKEMASTDKDMKPWTEWWRYHKLQFIMFMFRVYYRMLGMVGIKSNDDELEDFEVDF